MQINTSSNAFANPAGAQNIDAEKL
jgi:DNA replication licensing factor MCM3